MSIEIPDTLSPENNFCLLDQACLLLRATNDILVNESSDIFHMAYTCENEGTRRDVLNKLGLIYTGVSRAADILQTLSEANRSSWEP